MKKFLLLIVLVLFVPACGTVQTTGKTVTFQGTISLGGTLDSALELPAYDKTIDTDFIIFLTESKIGNIIFDTCGRGDMCEVTGTIEKHEYGASFTSVSKVRKIEE